MAGFGFDEEYEEPPEYGDGVTTDYGDDEGEGDDEDGETLMVIPYSVVIPALVGLSAALAGFILGASLGALGTALICQP